MHLTKKQSVFLSTVIVAVFFVGAILLIPSTKPLPEKAVGTPVEDKDATLVLNGFSRSEVKNGKVKWKIDATRGEFFKDKNILKLIEPNVTVFRDDGEQFNLTSRTAMVHLINNTKVGGVDAEGNVVIVSNKGSRVESERLNYDSATHIITSDTFVHMRSDKFDASGTGFLANTETQEATFKKNVTTTIFPAPRKKIVPHQAVKKEQRRKSK
jgi:LPS export ABC transporter protein LptC